MSPSAVLKAVKVRYPELEKLSKSKLRLVEKALVYANALALNEELLSSREHEELLNQISPKGGLTSAHSLRAYRSREDLTQQELSKKSGISQANISAMEKGRRPIGLSVAKKLAEILNCDYKKLI